MAAPNYYQAISDMPAPQRGGEESTLAAARATAQGVEIKSKQDSDLLGFLGTKGIEAFSGYKQATLQKEIDDTLNNTLVPGQYIGESVLARETLFAAKKKQAGDLQESDPQLGKFQQEVELLNEAKNQGTLSRDQAIARIAAAVKSWSADVPGLAGEFRKLAAEQTGISNIDVYGIHKALVSNSVEQKRVDEVAKFRLEQDKIIAAKEAIGLDEVTPTLRAKYHRAQQEVLYKEAIDRKIAIAAGTTSEKNEEFTTAARLESNKVFNTVVEGFEKLTKSLGGRTMDDANTAAEVRLGMENMLVREEARLVREFNSWGAPGPNRPIGWSAQNREEYIAKTQATFKEWRSWLSTSNGLSMFDKMVKNAKTAEEGMTSMYRVANPFLALAVANGTMSAYASLAVSANLNEDKLTAQLGGEPHRAKAKQILGAIGANPEEYARLMTGVLNGGRLDGGNNAPSSPDKTNPETAKLIRADLAATVIRLSDKKVLNDEDKTAFVKYMSAWGTNFNPSDKEQLKEYNEWVNDPRRTNVYQQLSPQQALEAVKPFMLSTQQRTATLSGAIKRDLDTFTLNVNEATTKLNAIPRPVGEPAVIGPKLVVSQDVFRQGALKVDVDWTSPENEKLAKRRGIAIPGAALELKQKVEELNTYAAGFAANAPVVHPKGKYDIDVAYKDALAIVEGKKTGFYQLKAGALDQPAAVQERRAPTPNKAALSSASNEEIQAELKALATLEKNNRGTDYERVTQLVRELTNRGIELRAVGQK